MVATATPTSPGPAATEDHPSLVVSHSGAADASGIQATNDFSNHQTADVHIHGINDAPVSVQNAYAITVDDVSAASATSGPAWAIRGIDAPPPSVALPRLPTSAPIVASPTPSPVTGLTAVNTFASSVDQTRIVPGASPAMPTATVSPIALSQSQALSVSAAGRADVNGVAQCSAPDCHDVQPLSTQTQTGLATPTGRYAASGAAVARGLDAHNQVTSDTDVHVSIGGNNYAPIQVIVESISHVVNFGVGSAKSGTSMAAQGASDAYPSQSPDVAATGADVRNDISQRSSSSIHVTGDNRNPISVAIDWVVDVVNRGFSTTRSADAVATTLNGAVATSAPTNELAMSGASRSSGLLVTNHIELFSSVSIDIDGSNYAPINVRIDLLTNVINLGEANATSGNAVSASAGAQASASHAPVPTSTANAGSATAQSEKRSGSSVASSGAAVVLGQGVDVHVVSSQSAFANSPGSQLQVATPASASLPAAATPTFDPDAIDGAPTPAAMVHSASGRAASSSGGATITYVNDQVATCKMAGSSSCGAFNSAQLSVETRTLTKAQSGFGGINATPTPTASAASNKSQPPLTSARSASATDDWSAPADDKTGPRTFDTLNSKRNRRPMRLPPYGERIRVNLWVVWPSPNRPPIPGVVLRQVGAQRRPPYGDTIDAQWLGGFDDRPPLPSADTDSMPLRTRGGGIAPVTRAATGSVMDIDPWSLPDYISRPPIPVHVGTVVPDAVPTPAPQSEIEVAGVDDAPTDAGGIDALTWILSALLATFVRLARHQFPRCCAGLRSQWASRGMRKPEASAVLQGEPL
jgi:hypothetical protein